MNTNTITTTPPRPVELGKSDLARLTVQVTVHHQKCCDDPITAHTNFTAVLASTEQAWVRQLQVGPELKKLDIGWLLEEGRANVSYIVLKNLAGLGQHVNPTEEEVRAVDAASIKLRLGPDGRAWRIRPRGGIFVAEPDGLTNLEIYIQSANGGAVPAVLYAMPR